MTKFIKVSFIFSLLFACLFSGAVLSKNNTHKSEHLEKNAITFEDICKAQQGKIIKATARGIYSFSMKAASGLYVEIERKGEGISSHMVSTTGNDYATDKLASDQTETLLSLAYLNQMTADFCLIDYPFPETVHGVRLHNDFE